MKTICLKSEKILYINSVFIDGSMDDTPDALKTPIEQALNSSTTYDEFESKLNDILADMMYSNDAQAVQKRLGQVLFASRMNGMIAGNNG